MYPNVDLVAFTCHVCYRYGIIVCFYMYVYVCMYEHRKFKYTSILVLGNLN